MKFEEIVAPTITELFEKQIQNMIFSGKLAIGERLPTERELSESMNISKGIVHVGVKNLEHMGFIRIVPRHGMFVANYPETGNVDTLLALLKYHEGMLDKHTIASCLQVREALEGMAMRLLAENHTEDHILHLRQCIYEIEKIKKEDVDEVVEMVIKFHKYIFIQTGNNVFPMILNAFLEICSVFWRTWVQQVGVVGVIELLNKFTDFIEAGNGEGAEILLRENGQQYLERI